MQQVIRASRIFNGEEWISDKSVLIEEGVITDVCDPKECSGVPVAEIAPGDMLVPGFIDAQVYGAAGRLFSVFPSPQTLQLMRETFLKQGTVLFQPTIATNTFTVFRSCMEAVRNYRDAGGTGVWGLHLEGPWLNAEKRGAHKAEWIHAPTLQEVRELLEFGGGTIKMITLAPENCSEAVLDVLRSSGIILSAGHSNATYAEAMQGFDKGITTITHLYNAMSSLHHRAPGLVGAALNHDRVHASIIPDGYHADYAAVSIAKKIMKERLFAITDAVTETDDGPYRHQLAGAYYECNGVLSGSALSMHQAFLNLVQKAGIDIAEALRMCSLYPAQVLGCAGRYGKIARGHTAQFLVLDPQLHLKKVIAG